MGSDLSNGIEIALDPLQSDRKIYTLILKDHLLPPNPNGRREQATNSWQYDFSTTDCSTDSSTEPSEAKLFVPWDSFKSTYRGKPSNDT